MRSSPKNPKKYISGSTPRTEPANAPQVAAQRRSLVAKRLGSAHWIGASARAGCCGSSVGSEGPMCRRHLLIRRAQLLSAGQLVVVSVAGYVVHVRTENRAETAPVVRSKLQTPNHAHTALTSRTNFPPHPSSSLFLQLSEVTSCYAGCQWPLRESPTPRSRIPAAHHRRAHTRHSIKASME